LGAGLATIQAVMAMSALATTGRKARLPTGVLRGV